MNSKNAGTYSTFAYRPLILVVGLALFITALINVSLIARESALAELYSKAQAELAQYRSNVEQRLIRYRSLPELLANHSLLYQVVSDYRSEFVREQANRYLQDAADLVRALDIYVMDAQGTTQAASNWLKPTSFIDRNFSFRPYFTDAMEGKAGSYFALGSTTNKRGYYFSYPMRQGEEIIGVVVVKIDLDEIEEEWNDPDSEILVSDSDSVVVISTRPDWMFKTLRPLEAEQMRRIIESLRYGDQPLNSLDIVHRETSEDGLEIITLLDGDSLGGQSLGKVTARQYFRVSTPLADTDLQVNLLVSFEPIEKRIFIAQAFTSGGFILLLLVWLAAFQRRRMRSDRLRFEAREAQARQENEARIAGIINNTNAGLSLIDTDGRIEYFNPFLERLFGYKLEELVGQPFYMLLSNADRPLMQQYVMREIDTREQYLRLEAECARANGSHFPAEMTLSTMLLGGRYHLIVTLVDITERRRHLAAMERVQEELEERVENRTADLQAANARLLAEVDQHRQTQNELIQAAKLAVIGQMSAGINHELNQPLTAIRNYADNSVKFIERQEPEKAIKNLQTISALTERMARIIHPLKEFARKSDHHSSRVCLRDLKDGAMSILYGQIEKEAVSVEWPGELDQYWVAGDLLRLEQVVVNLINNAIQALENTDNKRIVVKIEPAEQGYLTLSVCDSGPGLSDEAKARIFEPFFTTKSQGQGLGLGLSISQRIVASLGGELSVHSSQLGGAEFRIRLKKDGESNHPDSKPISQETVK